jgi:uncharacterized metal-binding protein
MPSGRIHAACSAILAVPAAFIPFGATADWKVGLAGGLGCLAGIALTPDLDQEGLSSSEHWIIKATFGLGFLWTMLWYPYARLCKHRSPLSHSPLLGTAGRLLYMGIFVAIAMYLGWKPPQFPIAWAQLALVGLLASDIAHWALDTRFGESSRRRRRR